MNVLDKIKKELGEWVQENPIDPTQDDPEFHPGEVYINARDAYEEGYRQGMADACCGLQTEILQIIHKHKEKRK